MSNNVHILKAAKALSWLFSWKWNLKLICSGCLMNNKYILATENKFVLDICIPEAREKLLRLLGKLCWINWLALLSLLRVENAMRKMHVPGNPFLIFFFPIFFCGPLLGSYHGVIQLYVYFFCSVWDLFSFIRQLFRLENRTYTHRELTEPRLIWKYEEYVRLSLSLVFDIKRMKVENNYDNNNEIVLLLVIHVLMYVRTTK